MRLGAFPDTAYLSHIPSFFPSGPIDFCPCCWAPVPETVAHILLECAAWSFQRDKLLDHLVWDDSRSTETETEIVNTLLGGSLPSDLQDPAGAQIGWSFQLMRAVVMFLESISTARWRHIFAYRESTLS